jgi:type II secretory pathway pseudopilin PulG
MELGILSGVAAIGYLLNQRNRENDFETNNQMQLNEYLRRHRYQQQLAQNHDFGYVNSCADSYPLYSPKYVKHQQRVLSGLPKVMPKNNTNTNKDIKKHIEQNHEEFTNFIPANDPTSEMLLDMKERPITDFYHNNMVPFYRGNDTKQNMAGTGVASGSYIDGSNVPGNITGINSGFDYSTPWQSMLGTFTGNDDTYLHKREVGPMFSPAEQQTGWVFGTPLFRPDMDRYTQGLSQIRNDLRPVEPEMVGPGLNLDPSIPASGGFHDFTRILPNNVNDYKANQLPGQVIAGKFYSAGLPTAYPGIGLIGDTSSLGVTKNRPNSFWDQTRYPTMTTKVGFQANLDYNIPQYEVDFKPNNATRDQISYGLGNIEYKNVQNQINEQFRHY